MAGQMSWQMAWQTTSKFAGGMAMGGTRESFEIEDESFFNQP